MKTFAVTGLTPEEAAILSTMVLYCCSQLRGDNQWMKLGSVLRERVDAEQIVRLQKRAKDLNERVEHELVTNPNRY